MGLAIQLVLSRPEPTTFKTWFDRDSVDLPPAVAWSAAALCGLRHGYRKLDTRFRGKQVQRELVAVQTLRRCLGKTDVAWPDVSGRSPQVGAGGQKTSPCHGVGRNLHASAGSSAASGTLRDLSVDATHREALAIANAKAWPCRRSVIHLEEGVRSISGSGSIMAHESQVKTRGAIEVDLLPGDKVEERLDSEAFRRLIATETGCIPAPPISGGHVEPHRPADAISGLELITDFLSEAEETQIVSEIDRADWSTELQRRVQHYGWRYDYKSRQVDPSMRIGPTAGLGHQSRRTPS